MATTQPRILVTGGTGFAGSHLIEELLRQGYENIYSTTHSNPSKDGVFLPLDHYINVDLTNAQATKELLNTIKPDWIFHLASFAYVGKSFEKASALFANNLNLQLSMLEGVREIVPTARILTIGSAEEYGVVDGSVDRINEEVPLNPVNPYAISKVTQDLLANAYYLSYKLSVIRARPFNHIGTRQTGDFAIPAFASQIVNIERGEQDVMLVGNLTGVRDFTDVSDMVRAYILLMEKGDIGQVYNIGSGVGYTIQEIVDTLLLSAKVPITVQVDQSRMRPLDAPRFVADNRKITALGWKPEMAIPQTLAVILEDIRNRK